MFDFNSTLYSTGTVVLVAFCLRERKNVQIYNA